MIYLGKERTISVVMNVYNEEEDIEDCLSSLEEQSLSDFELVIVDDGSTDGTMDIVEEFRGRFDLKTFRTEHVGIKKARKKAVKESTGEIIIVIDADEVLREGFVENLVEGFEDEGVGAVGGRLKSEGEGWVTEAYGALNEVFYKLRGEEEGVDWIQGGCSAYRREALEEVGGLAREKVSADKDISWKLKDAGWKVVLEEDAVAHHKDPQTLGSVMKREYGIGQREYSLLKKHRERFGLKELSRFYPLVGLILLGVVPFYWPLGLLLLGGVLSSMMGVAYLVYKNVEEGSLGISVKSWVVLTMINLAWSLGFIFSRE